jgi:DNA-binding XRE family transcriptional regulator
MAKQKLSKSEREECEKNLSTCRQLAATFEAMLAADDEAEKSAHASSEIETIKGIVKRDGASAGFLAVRLAGGRRGGPQQ